MAGVTTLPPLYRPLMDGPSIRLDECAVCHRRGPLNQHHVVFRSQGDFYRDGVLVPKPTITLCGFGNNYSPQDRYCHGMAHHHLLHFRYVGRWEFLITPEPTKYATALEMSGWMPIQLIG